MPNTIDLNNITIIGVDGVGNDREILKAIAYSKKYLPNAIAKFLTSGNHLHNHYDVQTVSINYLNYSDFSKFCLTELIKYIDTDYMINCHGDGFVVNPQFWSDEFLNYDYIGAPWPNRNLEYSSVRWKLVKDAYYKSDKRYFVGNGGFSLRSKKLLEVLPSLYKDEYYGIPEDLVISIILREKLEEMGFKFVNDISIAARFSCESRFVDGYILSSDNSFGFHCGETHPDKVKRLELL